MAAVGYTRQASANIQPNLDINAGDLNAEFNTLAQAFDSTSGHDHTGSVAGDGQKITLTTAVAGVLPTANGGTGSNTVTGTGEGVLQTSPTLITPTLTTPSMTTATVASGGLTVTAGGLTVSASGAAITGNSTVTGSLNATTGILDNSNRVFSASNPFHNQMNSIANPTGTASTTAVMTGLDQVFTPTISTRVLVIFTGGFQSNTTGDGATIDARYGTGTAPINGAAVTGTLIGFSQAVINVGYNFAFPFTIVGIITGLTLNTAYWFDLSEKAVTGGTANLTNVSCIITEI